MPTLSDLRNWSHSAMAIVGFLSVAYGIVTLALHQSGLSINTQWSGYMTVIGTILVGASKLIDSLNNALAPGAAQQAAAIEQAAKAAPAQPVAPIAPGVAVLQPAPAPVAAAPATAYPATAGAWPFQAAIAA